MQTDPISDFLTRIRNALSARLEKVEAPYSRLKFAIAKILEREGFVGSVTERADGSKKYLVVELKYSGKEPAIRHIKRISKPGLRVYRKSSELPRVLSGMGLAVVSTSVGVMTDRDARKRKLGGEIICEVY